MPQWVMLLLVPIIVIIAWPVIKKGIPWLLSNARESYDDLRWLKATAGTYVNGSWLSFFAGAVVYAALSYGLAYIKTVDVPVIVVPPVPTPIVEHGPRQILIAYESRNSDPKLNGNVIGLRSGEAGKYLDSKQHVLSILDVDAKDKDGNPTKAVQAWKEAYPGRQLPALVISDKNGKVVYFQTIEKAATTSQLLDIVRAHE